MADLKQFPTALEAIITTSTYLHKRDLAIMDGWATQNDAVMALARGNREPFCECGCAFEAHISALHVMIPCLTCRPCTQWRPVAA